MENNSTALNMMTPVNKVQIFDAMDIYTESREVDNIDTLEMYLTRWFLTEDEVNKSIHVMGMDDLYNKDEKAFNQILEFCYINGYKFHLEEFSNIGFIPNAITRDLYTIKNFGIFIPILGGSQLDTIKKIDELILDEYIEEYGKVKIEIDIDKEVNVGDMSIMAELRQSNLNSFDIPNDIYFSMIKDKDAIAVVKHIKKLEEIHGKYDSLIIDPKNRAGKVSFKELSEIIKLCYINGIECDMTQGNHDAYVYVYMDIYNHVEGKLFELITRYGNKVVLVNPNFDRWHTAELVPVSLDGKDGIVIKESDTPITSTNLNGLEGFDTIDMEGIEKISKIEKFINKSAIDNQTVRVIPECLIDGVGEKVDVDWKHLFS